jgi:hypothetical protein
MLRIVQPFYEVVVGCSLPAGVPKSSSKGKRISFPKNHAPWNRSCGLGDSCRVRQQEELVASHPNPCGALKRHSSSAFIFS